MKYLVHINPTPGSDLRVVEVEADYFGISDGSLTFYIKNDTDYPHGNVAAFSPAVWNYVEPKK